jgi:hypothetical protein
LEILRNWLVVASASGDAPQHTKSPELIPFGFDNVLTNSQWAEEHIAWIQRKDQLQQDVYLIGKHGPLKRWLALNFCRRLGREME